MNCFGQQQRRLQNRWPTARVPTARPSHQPVSLTYRVLLGKLHQTANLLADLGVGTQDVIALLSDLLEKKLLLWGGQAAGIVCLIPPCLPAPQIVELLQAARAKVLVAPAPEVDHELWQKTEQVQRIALVLQVRGPGNEREAAYAFNALVEEYPADCLYTGREIAHEDLAVILPLRDIIGIPGLVPLTHGHLLYIAWVLGLVTTLAQEDVLLRGLSRFFQKWWPAVDS